MGQLFFVVSRLFANLVKYIAECFVPKKVVYIGFLIPNFVIDAINNRWVISNQLHAMCSAKKVTCLITL